MMHFTRDSQPRITFALGLSLSLAEAKQISRDHEVILDFC